MDKTSGFKYQPLDSAGREIRLLNVQRSTNSSESVHCLIHTARLDNHPQYTALSYCWGDPKRTVPIFLNGCQIHVTTNLEEFLRHYRSNGDDSMLWIDALSIHQQDLAERSSQVLIMGEIYAQAKEVIAWIGMPDNESRNTLRFVAELAMRVSMSNDSKMTPDLVTPWLSAQTSPLFANDHWMPFVNLLSRPWFNRAWVVQEVVLAKKVSVRCGDDFLSWDDFARAAFPVVSRPDVLAKGSLKGYETAISQEDRDLWSERSKKIIGVATKVLDISLTRQNRREGITTGFWATLRRFAGRDSTDPLDQVYAFRGLATAEDKEILSIPIDYTTSPGTLYRQLTMAHLKHRRNLAILPDCRLDQRQPGFASWAPAWSSEHTHAVRNAITLSLLEAPPAIRFAAGTGMPAEFDFADSEETLLLRGVIIDRVRSIGPISEFRSNETIWETDLPYTLRNVHLTWRYLAGMGEINEPLFIYPKENHSNAIADRLLREEPYPNGMDSCEAFVRTIVCNPKADLETDYFSLSTTPLQIPVNSMPQSEEGLPNPGRVATASNGKRFFNTCRGYFGLGLPHISTGDVICVFFGGQTPFLLRPQANGTCYELVGETYIQGFMCGEVLELVRMGYLKSEIIALR